jgi:hypothetical protein
MLSCEGFRCWWLLRRCARVNQGNNPENKAYHYKKTNGVHATTCQAQPEVHDTPLQSWRGCYFFGLLPEYSKRRAVTRHASAGGRYQRRLTVALRPALGFDVRHLIWEVVPCRLAAGSAALERRPAVPGSGDVIIRARSPTAAPPEIARRKEIIFRGSPEWRRDRQLSSIFPTSPGEKTTARQDQTWQSGTGDGAGDRHSSSFERNAVGRACWSKKE